MLIRQGPVPVRQWFCLPGGATLPGTGTGQCFCRGSKTGARTGLPARLFLRTMSVRVLKSWAGLPIPFSSSMTAIVVSRVALPRASGLAEAEGHHEQHSRNGRSTHQSGRSESARATAVPPGRRAAFRHQRLQGLRSDADAEAGPTAACSSGSTRHCEDSWEYHSDSGSGAGHRRDAVTGGSAEPDHRHRVQPHGAGISGAVRGPYRQPELAGHHAAAEQRLRQRLPDRRDAGG